VTGDSGHTWKSVTINRNRRSHLTEMTGHGLPKWAVTMDRNTHVKRWRSYGVELGEIVGGRGGVHRGHRLDYQGLGRRLGICEYRLSSASQDRGTTE
jgi:hypothetical protein